MTEVSKDKPTAKKAAKKTAARHPSRLTTKQKAEAIALWQAGEVTFEQLSAKFGKSKTTFQKLFAKEGVRRGEKSREVAAQVASQVQRALTEDSALLAQRIKDTKEEHYKLSTAIAKMVGRIIMQAAQQGTSLAVHQNDFKALQAASVALKNAREERFVVLGIADGEKDPSDDLPEFEIRELTQDQILEMQKSRDSDADLESGLDEILKEGDVDE